MSRLREFYLPTWACWLIGLPIFITMSALVIWFVGELFTHTTLDQRGQQDMAGGLVIVLIAYAFVMFLVIDAVVMTAQSFIGKAMRKWWPHKLAYKTTPEPPEPTLEKNPPFDMSEIVNRNRQSVIEVSQSKRYREAKK